MSNSSRISGSVLGVEPGLCEVIRVEQSCGKVSFLFGVGSGCEIVVGIGCNTGRLALFIAGLKVFFGWLSQVGRKANNFLRSHTLATFLRPLFERRRIVQVGGEVLRHYYFIN